MAHPKRKISKTRRDKRRTHHKAYEHKLMACTNCGSATIYHHVCAECGHYRGKLAIEPKAVV